MSSVIARALVDSQWLPGSVATLYVATGVRTIIDKLTCRNNDGSAHSVYVYIVPPTKTADPSNLVSSFSVGAGGVYDAGELRNQILNPGDTLQVAADTTAVVMIRVSGRECS